MLRIIDKVKCKLQPSAKGRVGSELQNRRILSSFSRFWNAIPGLSNLHMVNNISFGQSNLSAKSMEAELACCRMGVDIIFRSKAKARFVRAQDSSSCTHHFDVDNLLIFLLSVCFNFSRVKYFLDLGIEELKCFHHVCLCNSVISYNCYQIKGCDRLSSLFGSRHLYMWGTRDHLVHGCGI